jgi:hypothetical protein
MPTMRRNLLIALCLAIPAAACWERHAESNDERAYFARDGHIYRVEMRGWRFPLVHDPISLLLERTYEETLSLELPRIEGVIEGTEIPVSPDKLRYIGRVVIAQGKMKVDLYYDDHERPGRPLRWNDEYTLVPQR